MPAEQKPQESDAAEGRGKDRQRLEDTPRLGQGRRRGRSFRRAIRRSRA
jgi:hypothetical protein